VAAAAGAAWLTGGGNPLVISSNDRSDSSHTAACAPAMTFTSRESGANPRISILIVHMPSARSGNL
jgi:hypothetical protein